MGKYNYEWRIDYYSSGCFLCHKYILAKNREDALRKLHESGEKVIEVLCCRRIDKW